MTQADPAGAEGAARHPEVDWEAVERSPEFQELVKKKRAFVIPGTIFFLAWYFGFIILAGYAPDFMGREFITDGLTVGYVLALSQFVMTWVLGWMYLRRSDKVFDPLAARARDAATGAAAPAATAEAPMTQQRFRRGELTDEPAPGPATTEEEAPRR
jgi:uncharacterized membrane protein (DUF485 family)